MTDFAGLGPFGTRGLELHVPALLEVRRDAWQRFSIRLRTLLETADYVGLTRAFTLTHRELDGLWGRLPGALWDAIVDGSPASDPSSDFVFVDADGQPWTMGAFVAQVASQLINV